VAVWLLAIVPVVALKLAVLAAAATVTDAGTVRDVLLLDSVTTAPPAGAIWVKVTVQALVALGPKLVGLQASEDTSTGATRLIAALPALPL
jgi:hypothetical protein